MVEIITSVEKSIYKKISFSDEEWDIIKKLIKIALDFEKDSFDLFQDLAISNNINSIDDAMKEIIEDENERNLIKKLNMDKELIKKIETIYKG